MRLNFALFIIPLLFSCSREKVKVELDDQIGVVPEIEIIGQDINPYQITQSQNGWIFCQEGAVNYVFVNQNYSVQSTKVLLGNIGWMKKRPTLATKDGRIFQLYVSSTASNMLFLHELVETGNLVQGTMLTDQLVNINSVALEAFSDSLLFVAVASSSGTGNSYKTTLYSFDVNRGILKLLKVLPGVGKLLGFHASSTGFWVGFYWQDHDIYNKGGSIMYFSSDGTQIVDRYFPELEEDAYYNNRTGLIRENSKGEAEVFASGAAQSMSGYNPFVCHLTIDKLGGLNAVHVYPETIGCFANDYYFANDQVYVLMKETYGTNITGHLVFNVFSLSGEPRYSKYIRNTEEYSNFIAIGHVDGFHATLFCADQNKSLLKLKF